MGREDAIPGTATCVKSGHKESDLIIRVPKDVVDMFKLVKGDVVAFDMWGTGVHREPKKKAAEVEAPQSVAQPEAEVPAE